MFCWEMSSTPQRAALSGLALVLIAGLREQLDFAEVPKIVKGTALTLLIAGILSLSFMGFAGLGGQ